MKLALCSIGDRKMDLGSIIELAAGLGYDGIELWEPHITRFIETEGGIESLIRLLEHHHLIPTIISTYGIFLPSDREYEQTMAHFANVILHFASRFHGASIRMFTDWIPSAKASDAEFRRIVQGLRKMAELAASANISLLLETHQDQLTDTTTATLRLLEEVGMDNVRVNLDIYNLYQIGEDPLTSLDLLFAYTDNVHLKNGVRPNGQISYDISLVDGEMDFVPFLIRLQEKNYTGYLAVEWFGERFIEAAKREIAWVKAIYGGNVL